MVEIGLERAQALGQAAKLRDQPLSRLLRLRQMSLDPLPACASHYGAQAPGIWPPPAVSAGVTLEALGEGE